MKILTFFIKLLLKRIYCLLKGKSFKEVNSPELFWDVIADNLNKKSSDLDDSSHIDIALENTKKYLNKNQIVLDFGCATGSDATKISGLVKQVDGVDISSKMIDIANKRVNGINNVHFFTLAHFDKENKSQYDALILSYVMHLLNDPQPIIRRVRNLLIPEGIFISTTACMGDMNLLLRIVMSFLLRIGLIPELSFFNSSKLINMIEKEDFEIIEHIDLKKGQKFIVAKKVDKT